ncbi:MAG: hypothetical protein ACKPKO_58885, partial [Candidatus Fonsibacter sp.]
LCFVGSKRYVKANNKYLPDYNPEEDSNYLMYWDANNLYGWAMRQSLPLDNLRFEEGTSLNKILKTPDDSPKCYIVEVDLEFPQHLHDKFKEFPPAPESITPKLDWFSDFQQYIGEKMKPLKMENTTVLTNWYRISTNTRNTPSTTETSSF